LIQSLWEKPSLHAEERKKESWRRSGLGEAAPGGRRRASMLSLWNHRQAEPAGTEGGRGTGRRGGAR
jgi:hypothetical protein